MFLTRAYACMHINAKCDLNTCQDNLQHEENTKPTKRFNQWCDVAK